MPDYASISLLGCMVNEYGPQLEYQSPGMMLAYITEMESAGLSIACRTCWGNPSGGSACFDNLSISGLLSFDGQYVPQGIYEVYRHLGVSKGKRVDVSLDDSTLAAMAYAESNASGVTKITAIVGAWEGSLFSAAPVVTQR